MSNAKYSKEELFSQLAVANEKFNKLVKEAKVVVENTNNARHDVIKIIQQFEDNNYITPAEKLELLKIKI